MYTLAIISSLFLLLISVPIFLVFGIGSSAAAILGLGLPWSTLIQVSFGAMTKHILILVLLPPLEFLNLLMVSVNKKGLGKLDLLLEKNINK